MYTSGGGILCSFTLTPAGLATPFLHSYDYPDVGCNYYKSGVKTQTLNVFSSKKTESVANNEWTGWFPVILDSIT